MSVDWDKLERDIDSQIERASDHADEKLAGQIAANTRLTQAEVQRLFPEAEDLKALARLIAIVGEATTQQQKVRRLSNESQALGGVIVKLIKQFV